MNRQAVRRKLIKAIAATPLLMPFLMPFRVSAKNNRPTAAQTPGPFYPKHAAAQPAENTDANLLIKQKNASPAHGERLTLAGEVVTTEGVAVPGASIEIWQCDATGHYHHPADRPAEERDDNFQGYGQTLTNSSGGYEFTTIVPVAYPGRTPHIHFSVAARGYRRLTTQMYLAGLESNASDFLYRGLSASEQQGLTVAINDSESADLQKQAFFRITLA